ncbi:MAG: DUF2809 domain-containing protein [Bacteroidota bacterium]
MSRLFKERQTVTSPNANSTGERRRIIYMILIFIVVSVGLGSRYYSNQLPGWVELYVGDTLWAFNVFLMLGFLFSRKTSLWVAVVAFSFSLLIEISQLYHAAWIDGIRAYKNRRSCPWVWLSVERPDLLPRWNFLWVSI